MNLKQLKYVGNNNKKKIEKDINNKITKPFY